jgi:cell division protein FtsL
MLYGEWASIPLYSANEDDSEVVLVALKFEEFMSEADEAGSFDELIKNDFFNRLRVFKESTHENFFAPLVTATAIECNVRIGNRYVDLIQQEKEKVEIAKLEDKYGFLHDQSISEAASKTLQLVDLLKQGGGRVERKAHEEQQDEKVEQPKNDSANVQEKPEKPENAVEKKERGKFAVNKWLLLATIMVVVVNIGLYVWMSYNAEPENLTQNVKKVNLENSSLKDFIREARIANNTFFAIVQTNWSTLNQEKKEEVLKKVYATGTEKGFQKVHLLDSQGKTVGFADAEKVQVY